LGVGEVGCGDEYGFRLANDGTALTLGPGITVRGHSGRLGYMNCFGGPFNVSVTNLGTVRADVAGGLIDTDGERFVNLGLLEALNGGHLNVRNAGGNVGQVSLVAAGTLSLNGTYTNDLGLRLTTNAVLNLAGNWSNVGGIYATNATVNLGGSSMQVGTIVLPGSILNVQGSFASAQMALISYAPGSVRLQSGSLIDNTGNTLVLDATTGSWLMNGGTLRGGTVEFNDGAQLLFSSGTLDGVTLNGELDVGRANNGAQVTVVNGLVLNGTAHVGNPTNNWYGFMTFIGTQELGGNGTVIFGNQGICNGFRLGTERAVEVLRRAGNFAFARPTRELLFTVVRPGGAAVFRHGA